MVSLPDGLAAKVTGMILEIDAAEVMYLIESPHELRGTVIEALQTLSDHLLIIGDDVIRGLEQESTQVEEVSPAAPEVSSKVCQAQEEALLGAANEYWVKSVVAQSFLSWRACSAYANWSQASRRSSSAYSQSSQAESEEGSSAEEEGTSDREGEDTHGVLDGNWGFAFEEMDTAYACKPYDGGLSTSSGAHPGYPDSPYDNDSEEQSYSTDDADEGAEEVCVALTQRPNEQETAAQAVKHFDMGSLVAAWCVWGRDRASARKWAALRGAAMQWRDTHLQVVGRRCMLGWWRRHVVAQVAHSAQLAKQATHQAVQKASVSATRAA